MINLAATHGSSGFMQAKKNQHKNKILEQSTILNIKIGEVMSSWKQKWKEKSIKRINYS